MIKAWRRKLIALEGIQPCVGLLGSEDAMLNRRHPRRPWKAAVVAVAR